MHVNTATFTLVNMGSSPLAVFAGNRWLRRKAHFVFAVEATGTLSGESPKQTLTHIYTHTCTKKKRKKKSAFISEDLLKILSNSISKKSRELSRVEA